MSRLRRSWTIAGWLRVGSIVLLILLVSAPCYSSDVVFVRSQQDSSAEQEQLQIAADFYGANLKVILVSSADDQTAIKQLVNQEETVGLAIAANALDIVNDKALLKALEGGEGRVPLLIVGVTPDVSRLLSKSRFANVTSAYKRLENPLSLQYVFGRIEEFTFELSDLEVPLRAEDLYYLAVDRQTPAQRIASVRSGDHTWPVFIESRVDRQEVFIAAAATSDQSSTMGEPVVNAFLRDAPAMMFIRYCVGEGGWHELHHYANLTVDDPWLRQPYGYIDYNGLLDRMQKHGFHTTIAFIPWNYSRSKPEVVSLFRNHPDRFSIAIHGDNHDHKEFTEYRSKPLAIQIEDLKQSLARMEKFRELTGIGYDQVMIFPHNIPPEKTLEALKTYNYLATVNSTNIPQGTAEPQSLPFFLRPVTLSFAGFPSISRQSIAAPISRASLAINKYLGNPLFFYGHSDDFAKGIGAFDAVADEVNQLDPGTQWHSLGEIIKHLYLVRVRTDSDYDVLAFSNNICLENAQTRNLAFHVRKQESGPQSIHSVLVDGQPYPYAVANGFWEASIQVSAGGTRCIVIEYRNDLQLATIDIGRHSLLVYLLRTASDFRDIYLSKSSAGLAFIRFYYEHALSPAWLVESALIFMVICIFAFYRLRESIRSKRHS